MQFHTLRTTPILNRFSVLFHCVLKMSRDKYLERSMGFLCFKQFMLMANVCTAHAK